MKVKIYDEERSDTRPDWGRSEDEHEVGSSGVNDRAYAETEARYDCTTEEGVEQATLSSYGEMTVKDKAKALGRRVPHREWTDVSGHDCPKHRAKRMQA